MQPDILKGDAAARYADILKAIGHPVRLRIIDILTCGERNVGELEGLTEVKQAIISQQLKILRLSRLVDVDRRDGKAFYRLAELHLKDLMRCLRKCGR
jgi:DNA-binding transcriptional ArsR family regulator